MPYYNHPGIGGGPILLTQQQYDSLYSGLGWVLTSPPTGIIPVPPSNWLHFAGLWASETGYEKGDVVLSPGGGLLQAYDTVITDVDFGESGFTRLTPDQTTGITVNDNPPDDPAPNAIWWNTSGAGELLYRWDDALGDWQLFAGTGGSSRVSNLDDLLDVDIAGGSPTYGASILAWNTAVTKWTKAQAADVLQLTSPDGTNYKLTVANGGALTATSVAGGGGGPTPEVLPTGAGIYTYAAAVAAGHPGIEAASAWVATQAAAGDGSRGLTFPTGVYTIVPSFGSDNVACNLSTAVSHYGQGPTFTIFQVNGTFAPGTQDPLPTTGTNSLYVIKQEGGTNLKFQGIGIDCNTHPIIDTRTLNSAGGANAQLNQHIPYNIMRSHNATAPLITRVLITGGKGTANTPPGETFSFNLWACTNAVFTDVEIDGAGLAGALFGVNGNNNGSPVTYVRCYAHDSAHSHGWAMFQAGRVNRTDCRSDNNGSGTGSSGGAGFNHEGSGPVVALRDSSTGNALVGYRFEAGPVDGGSNRTDHVLTSCATSGSPYGLRTEKSQTSVPTLNSCSIAGTLGQFQYKA